MAGLVEGAQDDRLGVRSLHGDERGGVGFVGQVHIGAGCDGLDELVHAVLESCDHGGRVRGVGDDEELFVADAVGDEVIEQAA